MKRHLARVFAALAAVMFLSLTVLELTAHARAGGGRSFGGGSRSYSRQASPAPYQSTPRQQYAPAGSPFQQQAGGGFMRSMAGGLAGGMLGSMLFGGMAGAGGPGGAATGGGGIGLFEILLLAGGGYVIYRLMKRGRG